MRSQPLQEKLKSESLPQHYVTGILTDGTFLTEEELICQPWLANKDIQLKSKKSPVRKTSQRFSLTSAPYQQGSGTVTEYTMFHFPSL